MFLPVSHGKCTTGKVEQTHNCPTLPPLFFFEQYECGFAYFQMLFFPFKRAKEQNFVSDKGLK